MKSVDTIFNGRVFIPLGPVDLPPGTDVILRYARSKRWSSRARGKLKPKARNKSKTKSRARAAKPKTTRRRSLQPKTVKARLTRLRRVTGILKGRALPPSAFDRGSIYP